MIRALVATLLATLLCLPSAAWAQTGSADAVVDGSGATWAEGSDPSGSGEGSAADGPTRADRDEAGQAAAQLVQIALQAVADVAAAKPAAASQHWFSKPDWQSGKTGQGVVTAIDSGEGSGEMIVGVSFTGTERINLSFFAHEPFGFGPETFAAIATDLVAISTRFASWCLHLLSQPSPVIVRTVLPWLAFVVLLVLTVLADRRLRRHFDRVGERLAPRHDAEHPVRTNLRRSLVQLAGGMIVPVVAWAASYVVLTALFDKQPWTRALSSVLAVFIGYRFVRRAAVELFGGDIVPVPLEAGSRMLSATRFSLRLILFFAAMTIFVVEVEYRDDVSRLAMTMFRASMTLLFLQLFALQKPLVGLLPETGNTQWIRFRAAFARYMRWVLIFSLVLLLLWTLGFVRAASTIFFRSYGIIGLLVLAMLAQRWFEKRVEALDPLDQRMQSELLRSVDGFARACLHVGFITLILALLGLLEPLLGLLGALRIIVGETPISMLNVLKAGIALAIGILGARLIRIVFERGVFPAMEIDVGAAYALMTGINVFVAVLTGGITLVMLGINFSALAIFAGALGVGIGFGMQNIARNLISGFVLLFGRSVEKGDLITVDNKYSGYVERITARAVTIKTRDNYEMVVPSSTLLEQPFVNWTHTDPLIRLHIPVGVAYNSDIGEVREALMTAGRRYPRRVLDRDPEVWLVKFGDSAIDVELLLWVDARQVAPGEVEGTITFLILEELQKRGIEIPVPQRDLYIKSMPPLQTEHRSTSKA